MVRYAKKWVFTITSFAELAVVSALVAWSCLWLLLYSRVMHHEI